jgi:hypothetical protein
VVILLPALLRIHLIFEDIIRKKVSKSIAELSAFDGTDLIVSAYQKFNLITL